MPNKPLLVGITGGIGSGKSTVCRVFQSLGVPVYDADSRARWVMNNDPDLIQEVKNSFGQQSYKNGLLDREYLGKLVFPNPEKLALLNAITHPAVALDFEKWVNNNLSNCYLVKEAALLVESKAYLQLDKMILVTASEDIRIARVLDRDKHRSRQDVLELMKRQLSEEEKRRYCDYVIDNGEGAILPYILELDFFFKLF